MLGADYVLLLGVLLVGADLAYIETQLRLLGPEWAYHLLVVALHRSRAWRTASTPARSCLSP